MGARKSCESFGGRERGGHSKPDLPEMEILCALAPNQYDESRLLENSAMALRCPRNLYVIRNRSVRCHFSAAGLEAANLGSFIFACQAVPG
jgi:hypothetical protein